MNVDCYVSNEFDRRAEKKMFEDIIYQLQEFDSDEEVSVIGNLELVDTQLDMLVIKENCLTIIEMKNYKGEIIGSENGNWEVRELDGELIDTGRNLFQQVKNQRFSLQDKIENIIKNGKLSKFSESPDVFHHKDAWLCFKNGSNYDHDQIHHKALNWFKVITVDSLPKEIISTNSSGAYSLSKDDIGELIDSLSAKPYVLEEDNNNLVKDKWAEVEVYPDDPKIAKKAKKTFEMVLEKTRDEELKHICKHGMALTSEKYEETLEILLELYDTPNYDGYKNNAVDSDILIEYLRWDPSDDKTWDELEETVEKIFSHLKEERKVEKIRDIFLECKDGLFETPYSKDIYIEMGSLLRDEYPDDFKILEGMMEYYAWEDGRDKFIENAKKLVKNKIKVSELIDLIIGGELNYIPVGDFEEIISYIDDEDLSPIYTPTSYTLGSFYNMKLSITWDELSSSERENLWEKAESAYKDMVDTDDIESLYKITRWYYRWEKTERAKKYARTIVEKDESDIKENLNPDEIHFLIGFFKKIGEKFGDFSLCNKIIQKGLQIYPKNHKINAEAGTFYEDRNRIEDAIQCYDRSLKEADELGTNKLLHYLEEGNEDMYDLLKEGAEETLNSLLEFYFEENKYKNAFDLCEWLNKQNIKDSERYTASAYQKIGDHLIEKSSEYMDKKEEISSSGEDELNLSLDDFAMSSEQEKEIRYIINRVKEREGSYSVLFDGPPGVGKSRLARCIAGEMDWKVKELNSKVLDKWVGNTEDNIREIFEEARKGKGTVIIIDEFEFLGQDRREQKRSHELSRLSTMLEELEKTMDQGERVLVIGTANYSDRIDRAIKRKGRINERIKIGKPDNNIRKEIFKIKLNELEEKGWQIAEEMNYDKLAKKSEGLTGAQIDDIVINKADKILFSRDEEGPITEELVLEAIDSVKNEDSEEKRRMPYSW